MNDLFNYIYPYHYSQDMRLFKAPKNDEKELMIGIELEFENVKALDEDKVIDVLSDLFIETNFYKEAIIEEDYSLDDGFELITKPFFARDEEYINRLKYMIDKINELNPTFSNGCGMHIHIDNRSFKSNLHRLLLTHIINNNEKFFLELSGRDEVSQFAEFENEELEDMIEDYRLTRYCYGGDKYVAVNPCPKTLELRFFRGTGDINEIQKRIKWVENMVSAINQLSTYNIKKNSLSWKYINLTKFVEYGIIEK